MKLLFTFFPLVAEVRFCRVPSKGSPDDHGYQLVGADAGRLQTAERYASGRSQQTTSLLHVSVQALKTQSVSADNKY